MTPAQTIKLSAAKTYLAGFDPVAQDKLGVLLTLIEELDLECAKLSTRPTGHHAQAAAGCAVFDYVAKLPVYAQITEPLSGQDKVLKTISLLANPGTTVYRLLDPEELTQEGDDRLSSDSELWVPCEPGLPASRVLAVRRKVADESTALRSEVFSLKAAIVEAQNLYGEDCASYTGTIKELREKVAAHEGATYYTPGEKGALGQVAQIETLLKTYGWPSRAEGRTMIEYLSALLTTFTHQGGVIEGLKHRREESPMMALARAASTKTEEPVARLQERLDAFSGALRDGQMSLDNLITRMTPKGPTLHDVTNIALAHAIIAEALGPKGLVVDEVDFGVFDKSRAHQPITIVAHTA